MFAKSSILIALASLFVVPWGAFAEDKPKDTVIELLQGRWEIVAGVNQGHKLSALEVDGTYVTITTNKITTYDRNEQQRYQAVFQVDEAKKPVEINMSALRENEPTDKPSVSDKQPSVASAPGILKFVGKDHWQMCYALPGAKRPEKFESPEGSKNMLFTLKKKEKGPPRDAKETDADPTK